MSIYGFVLLPLMDLVNEGVLQKWYADDGNVAGSIKSLQNCFGKMKLHAPAFGYKITKCYLISKDSSLDKAKDLFRNEDDELVGGHRMLGSIIGSSQACHAFQSSKFTEYANIVSKLASRNFYLIGISPWNNMTWNSLSLLKINGMVAEPRVKLPNIRCEAQRHDFGIKLGTEPVSGCIKELMSLMTAFSNRP